MQAQIQRHLVVAGARRVQHPGGLPEVPRQEGLHRHVHVLLVREERRAFEHLQQRRPDRRRDLARHDPGPREHDQVRHRPDHVLAQQLPVERQRAGKGQHLGQELRSPRGGAGANDGHLSIPPCCRENSCSCNPSRWMKPSAAR